MKGMQAVMRVVPLTVLLAGSSGCAASSPRYTDAPGGAGSAEPGLQQDDLRGELLVPPPERRAEDLVKARPDAVLPLAGAPGGTSVPADPVALPPAPDTTRVFQPPPPSGPRKEYQVQVAITPSAQEAEEFKLRLETLLAGEEVFIVFTRPYYRIRVGRRALRQEADDLLARLARLGYENSMVIPVTITPPPDDPSPGPADLS